MSKSWVKCVQEFHAARGQTEPPMTALIPGDVRQLRQGLMDEELNELKEAMHERYLDEIADGLCDLLYVTIGTAIAYGLGPILDQLFQEVHRSNMTKVTGPVPPSLKYAGEGKPAGYEPPQLLKIIEDHDQQKDK